jgi:histidinol dehydrogenase
MPDIARLSTAQPDFADRLAKLIAFDAALDEEIERAVAAICKDVRERGDAAVLQFTARFDGVQAADLAELELSRPALEQALSALEPGQREALDQAAVRIRAYHERQLAQSWQFTESDGTVLGQRVTPIDRVGVYVPGGKAAYHPRY